MANETIRVRLVSEAAEYVSITQIIHKDYSPQELIGAMLPVTGRDWERIRQLFRMGGFSNGEYKFSWEGRELSAREIDHVLDQFPRAEPQRSFDAKACFLIRFVRDVEVLGLPKEAADKKGLFSSESFWEGLIKLAGSKLRYTDYSFGDQADVYTYEVDVEAFRALLPLMKPKSASERIEHLRPEKIQFLTRR